MIKYLLCTDNPAMEVEWRKAFSDIPAFEILLEDILSVPCDALVSPANSRGWMDGGLDREINRFFEWKIEERVISCIEKQHNGLLSIGKAVIVETHDNRIPFLIVSPTMEMPGPVPESANAYLAMKATLRAIEHLNVKQPGIITRVAIPAFCAGVGMMPLATVAWQMKKGWNEFVKESAAGNVTNNN